MVFPHKTRLVRAGALGSRALLPLLLLCFLKHNFSPADFSSLLLLSREEKGQGRKLVGGAGGGGSKRDSFKKKLSFFKGKLITLQKFSFIIFKDLQFFKNLNF